MWRISRGRRAVGQNTGRLPDDLLLTAVPARAVSAAHLMSITTVDGLSVQEGVEPWGAAEPRPSRRRSHVR